MKKLANQIGRSLKRLALPATGLLALVVDSCAPLLDPNHSDQAPDVNYEFTAAKDAQFVGSIAAVDAIVNDGIGTRYPGAAIAIVSGGKVVYMKGYGLADAEAHVPFTKDTVAGIGSVSKVLTAMGIMKLVEMDKVNLDASIDTYFPFAVPAGWNSVTVRNLLSHTGGFERDPDSGLPGALTAAQIDAAFGLQKASQHPRYAMWEFLNTSQGAIDPAEIGSYSYSNLGYVVLGAIIDQVTQAAEFAPFQGYERFLWSQVGLSPSGSLTAVLNHPWRAGDIPNLARSYNASWNPFSTNWSGWQSACGGWSMTIGDLARLAISLDKNQVLSPASLAAMQVNHAAGNFYGLGLQLEFKADKVAYSHAGAIDGFRTQFTVWPERDVAVVGFVNAGKETVGGSQVDLEAAIDEIVSEIGDYWIDLKENIQVVEVHFSEEDRSRMNTPLFEFSRTHSAGAERTLQALLRSESGDEEAVLGLLETELGRQGEAGRLFLDAVRGEKRDLEGVAAQFVALLDADRHVGPFKPTLTKATLGAELKGRWAYAGNGGWLDGHWDPAARDGGKGVMVSENYLAGQAYAGNFGWIGLGDGTPMDGIRYSNSGADFGVNLDLATGELRGHGYGGNIGWVTFEKRGNPRLDLVTGCLLGYAYSANCGWINLAPREGKIGWQTHGLAPGLDEDGDGLPDGWELEQAGDLLTLNGWGDHDHDGASDVEEHAAGTDPTDPQSKLSLWVTQAPEGVEVWWTSQPNRLYTLYETHNLADWEQVPEAIEVPGDASGTMAYEMNGLDGIPRMFWRVEAKLPLAP